jgi:hypothetical protein
MTVLTGDTFEETGKAGDFSIEDAEFAIDFLDLEIQVVGSGGGLGDDAVHGGADELGDTARTMGSVEGLQRFELRFGEAQAYGAALSGGGQHLLSSDGGDPFAIDFDGDGTLQEGDGCDEAEGFFDFHDYAFGAGEGAVVDADAAADGKSEPGLDTEGGAEHGLDGGDFGIGDGSRPGAEADDPSDAGGLEDGEAMDGVEAAEDVTGEEGEIELLDAVRPAAAGVDEREELLIALTAESGGCKTLEFGTDPDGIPRVSFGR